METIRHYLARFEDLAQDGQGTAARRQALERFAAAGFPSPKDEEWRATDLAPLAAVPFAPAPPASLEPVALERLVSRALLELPGPRLVFVNGRFAPELSTSELPEGLEVTTRGAPDLLEADERRAFRALNAAFFGEGAGLRVAAGAALESPIHLVHVTVPGAEPSLVAPRSALHLGERSRATLVESFVGGSERTFTNAVTEVRLEAGATLEHYRLEHESRSAFHLGATTVAQAQGSRYVSFVVADGGALSRHELEVTLGGEGASCALSGLSLVSDRQLADHHTFVDHATARCRSEELYKGVFVGAARGVFRGRVLVRPGAQKTDARQANRNLLLSREAQVNSKPQLEIHADDVKCTHGSAVGQLDREALFYLRARGLGEAEARSMLTEAFAGEVTARMALAPVRASVEAAVRARLLGREEEAQA